MNKNNIFIDTNVLIGAYADIEKDKKAWLYLISLNGKRLFTSSLSIAQLASVFQKKRTNSEIIKIITDISHRVEILSCTKQDIQRALEVKRTDIEDNIQYVISSKMKCYYFITNNIKDYNNMANIVAVKPDKIRKTAIL